MIRATVAGAAGRMGKRIIAMIHERPDMELLGAFEMPEHPLVGRDAGRIAGVGDMGVEIRSSIDAAGVLGDVIIDFTSPPCTLANLRVAAERGVAMVIGTTGMEGDLLEEVRGLAPTIRCVMAPNMSVGVNVMFRIAGEMARILGNDYDMEILELHHRLKKDAPSGTALKLANILAQAAGRDLDHAAVFARRGVIGERTDEEIGVQCLRAGDITGEHTVLFGGIGERLELTHRAHNRDNFARGAIRAACWVVRQPEGLYDMQDVLGLGRK